MEHRHFPRKSTERVVRLITNEGYSYLAKILEVSAIGLRVMINEKLPERIKIVDVILPSSNTERAEAMQRLPMLIVRKNEYELGLCLVDEQEKINLEPAHENIENFSKARKIVNQ